MQVRVPQQIFFVMDAPKSGTTWLQAVLDAHPDVTCSGEGHFIEKIATPLTAMFTAYREKMGLVAERVYDGKPSYPWLTDDTALEIMRATVLTLMRTAPGAQHALWLGDKTPAYTGHIRGLNLLFPQARFINIVRDPRDVAASLLNHLLRSLEGRSSEIGEAKRAEMIELAIGRWRRALADVEAAAAGLGGRLINVRYEDLKGHFAASVSKLFAHLGVACEGDVLAQVAEATSFQRMSGGRQAGDRSAGAFFYGGVVGGHLRDLRADEIGRIETELASLMRAHGYLPDPV